MVRECAVNKWESKTKLTKGCRKVLKTLEETGDLSSAQGIYSRLRVNGGEAIGLTTVYRSLGSLVNMGLVQAINPGDGERLYEAVAPGKYHHHLVCQCCSQYTHMDQCLVRDIEAAVQSTYGFEVESHILEIFGTCAQCLKNVRKS